MWNSDADHPGQIDRLAVRDDLALNGRVSPVLNLVIPTP